RTLRSTEKPCTCAFLCVPSCSLWFSFSLVDVRQLAEDLVTLFDLLARELLQALGAESFDGKRTHHAAVEHGALEDVAGELVLRSDVAHEAAGKAVARAGGVDYALDRQRGRTEGMPSDSERAFLKEDGGAVFPVLDHQRLWPHLQHFLRSASQAG